MMKHHQNNSEANSRLLVFILTSGVFGIINTEMGVAGILPLIAETFHVSIPEAGWTVGLFALVVAISAPFTPLLFSRFNRKLVMLTALGAFTLGNLVAAVTDSFTVLLLSRAIPAFLHPVYVSMAFSVATASVPKSMAHTAAARIFMGVSAGMVLGVPFTSYIANTTSFAAAMWFFSIITMLVFMATIIFVPSLPVEKIALYKTQLQVLKKPVIWQSILTVIMINGAMFGFFSYMSDFLERISGASFSVISGILLIYGLSNIIGNALAGKFLSKNATACITFTPLVLFAAYLSLLVTGSWLTASVVLLSILGILAGISSNNMQYIMAGAAEEFPDFANGLFLTSANLGTMAGTWICGIFIHFINTRYSLLGSLLLLSFGIILTLMGKRSRSILHP